MPEEFDAGTRKAKNIMDSFIEALYGRSEETIPEEYDWFAPVVPQMITASGRKMTHSSLRGETNAG